MPIQHEKNTYRVPRGRAYFDPWDANEQLTGERPFGNTPEFTVAVSGDSYKHQTSAYGIGEYDASWDKPRERSAKFSCDNMSSRNLTYWTGGTQTKVVQNDTAVTDEVRNVLPGCIYQLGSKPSNPLGVRGVTNITVTSEDGVTDYTAGVDYNVDPDNGRVQIIEGGAIVAGPVAFGYKPIKSTYTSVTTEGAASVYGALRIVADNPQGGNEDWYFPKVKLSADGDLSVISTDTDKPVTMQFTADILTPANGAAMYCGGRPVATP